MNHDAQAAPAPGGRTRWLRVAVGIVVFGTVLTLVLHAPSAMSAFISAFSDFRAGRLPWLGLAAVLEAASLASAAMVQRQLLGAGRSSLPFPTLAALTVASTSIGDLLPAGAAPATGWMVEQYRLRRVPTALALWSALAGGFASTVSGLALVLVGAGFAKLWNPVALVLCGVVLVAGSTGFALLAQRLAGRQPRSTPGWRRSKMARAVIETLDRGAQYRASPRVLGNVFAFATLNWLLDAACLVLGFVLVGFAVPWSSVLFAYAGSQMLGGLSFVQIGVVEGGMVGAFVLTGTKAGPALAAVLMYRVVSYWMVLGAGALVFLGMTRLRGPQPALPGGPARPFRPTPEASPTGFAGPPSPDCGFQPSREWRAAPERSGRQVDRSTSPPARPRNPD